jgi:hypothetical protein
LGRTDGIEMVEFSVFGITKVVCRGWEGIFKGDGRSGGAMGARRGGWVKWRMEWVG